MKPFFLYVCVFVSFTTIRRGNFLPLTLCKEKVTNIYRRENFSELQTLNLCQWMDGHFLAGLASNDVAQNTTHPSPERFTTNITITILGLSQSQNHYPHCYHVVSVSLALFPSHRLLCQQQPRRVNKKKSSR